MREYDWKAILTEGAAALAIFAFFCSIAVTIVNVPQDVVQIAIPAAAVVGFLVGTIHQFAKQQAELIRTAAFDAAQAAAAQRSTEKPTKPKKPTK